MLPDRSRRSPTRYNSAVYASLVNNDYDIFLVSQAFVDGTVDGDCVGRVWTNNGPHGSNYTSFEPLSSLLRSGTLERLERTQCITEYAKMVQPARRNLLLVATNEDVRPKTNLSTGLPLDRPCIGQVKNNTGVYWMSHFSASEALEHESAADSYRWLCIGLETPEGQTRDSCARRVEEIKKAPQWTVRQSCYAWAPCDHWNWPVDYCLSERVTSQCELHFSTVIAVIVTILNFCKSKDLSKLYLSSTLCLLDVCLVRTVQRIGIRS
jgi:hypothetical protein